MSKKWRKGIALLAAVMFLLAVQTSLSPLKACIDESGTAVAAAAGNDASGYVTKESEAPAKVKSRNILPVLLPVLLVAAGAAVYFLVIKKPKYTLTVDVAPGLTGSPASGTYTYKKGDSVAYSYSAPQGYCNLAVTLDGQPAAAAGSIKMNGNHTLSVTATKQMKLTVTITNYGGAGSWSGYPASGTYYYDSGTVVPLHYQVLVPPPTVSIMQVTIDGVVVHFSRAPYDGSVKMDTDHSVGVVLQ